MSIRNTRLSIIISFSSLYKTNLRKAKQLNQINSNIQSFYMRNKAIQQQVKNQVIHNHKQVIKVPKRWLAAEMKLGIEGLSNKQVMNTIINNKKALTTNLFTSHYVYDKRIRLLERIHK